MEEQDGIIKSLLPERRYSKVREQDYWRQKVQ